MIGEGGASPEFLVELHQQTTLTLSFTTMKLCNGHTDQTAAKTVTPKSLLAQELDACMPGMDGDAQLNFSSLVDGRRAPVSILSCLLTTHIMCLLTLTSYIT